jgi:hypothetical protein
MLNRKAQTLSELLIASVITVIIVTSAMGIFVVSKTFYATSMAGQELQRDVNGIVERLGRGVAENWAKTGLRSAVSFTIQSVSHVNFTGMDGNTREYYLSSGGIIYASPEQLPNPRTIYSAPANSTLTLRFWKPYADYETIGIYVSLAKIVSGRTISGSLTTFVNIKNLPK